MEIDTAATTEREKPGWEFYADGKIKRIRDAHPSDSPAQPPPPRICYVCHEGGGSFNAVRDIEDVLRIVHRAQNVGDPSAMYTECQQGFEATRRADAFRQVKEYRDRQALAAYRAEGGDPARLEPSPVQRGIDCPEANCTPRRFFDTQAGVESHRREAHKETE